MNQVLKIQKLICSMTDIRQIRSLVDSLYAQQTRIERYLALFFSIGDRVTFDNFGCALGGIVTRINQVTVSVSVDSYPDSKLQGGDAPGFTIWKVPASKLRFLEKFGKADFTMLEIPPPIYDESVTKDDRR